MVPWKREKLGSRLSGVLIVIRSLPVSSRPWAVAGPVGGCREEEKRRDLSFLAGGQCWSQPWLSQRP